MSDGSEDPIGRDPDPDAARARAGARGVVMWVATGVMVLVLGGILAAGWYADRQSVSEAEEIADALAQVLPASWDALDVQLPVVGYGDPAPPPVLAGVPGRFGGLQDHGAVITVMVWTSDRTRCVIAAVDRAGLVRDPVIVGDPAVCSQMPAPTGG